MTVETRTTIDVGDLLSIEIECPKCHQRTVRKFSAANYFPRQCDSMHCRTVFYADPSREYNEMLNALDTLGKYATSEKNPMVLRFEVKSS